jgi:hypothetical protein
MKDSRFRDASGGRRERSKVGGTGIGFGASLQGPKGENALRSACQPDHASEGPETLPPPPPKPGQPTAPPDSSTKRHRFDVTPEDTGAGVRPACQPMPAAAPGIQISVPKRAREAADVPKGFVLSQFTLGTEEAAPSIIQPSKSSSAQNEEPAAWMQRRIQACCACVWTQDLCICC